ncbi:MAG: DUF2202 domain-containing protein [Flavobacteriaceae bacterium]
MKTISTLKVALWGTLAITQIGCSNADVLDNNTEEQWALNDLNAQIAELPQESLSDAEISGLMHLREEEKLAQDVYLFLYQKYGTNIFNNIGQSESTHMAAVESLIEKYDLIDPVDTNGPGVLENQELQELYNSLVDQGSESLLAAYQVGAAIEDLDLYDLAQMLAQVVNQDITQVYENLSKGSRNHMRSFFGKINGEGATYTSQFIDQALLEAIVNSPKETGGR